MILDEIPGSMRTLLTSHVAIFRVITNLSLWGVSMPWRSGQRNLVVRGTPSRGCLSAVINMVT